MRDNPVTVALSNLISSILLNLLQWEPIRGCSLLVMHRISFETSNACMASISDLFPSSSYTYPLIQHSKLFFNYVYNCTINDYSHTQLTFSIFHLG